MYNKSFFYYRDPSEMYAEAFGFGAGACVAGCCGGGQGFDPFAQFRSKFELIGQ